MKIIFFILAFIFLSFWFAFLVAVGTKAGLQVFFKEYKKGGKESD